MSESENFDLDNVSASEESEDYAPAPKKSKAPATAKATAKSATTKAAKAPAKAKAAPKKKTAVLKEIHDNGSEDDAKSGSDDDGAYGGAKRVEATEDDEVPIHNKGKTAHEKYQVLDQIEHILKRPDSYVGSLESIRQNMWVFDSETKRMVFREIKYAPAFLKIFDEILVNAADNKVNDPNMDTLKVNIDIENSSISIHNNGAGIPIVIHEKEKVYIPQMIFGQLLSSSNYDDTEKKVTGGRNGYGAKLTNIYSKEFTVETADKSTGLLYKQTWTDNMGKRGKEKITKNTKGAEYTRITFKPDLARFGMDSIDADIEALLMRRVYDMAGTLKGVKVSLNDEKLKIKGFKSYVEMYLSSMSENAEGGEAGAQPKQTVIYEQISPRWEVAFALSDGSFQQISFANAIATTKGGTHVTLIADQIAKNLITGITKKNKGATVKPVQIRNQMFIFVNALIENPTFDSQTKDTLTLPASKFGGSKPQVSDEFMKKVSKSGIVDNVLNWATRKADELNKKTDGSKRTRLTGLTKLSDANNAGGRNASKCTLILTEGDSAKSLAMAGLTVVGRDNFGVFPLRGKLLNVREARHDQIMKNEEIQAIKKILGLQHNKQYDSVSSLRYGSVMIMTDQDHDGSHIKGLLINFFEHFYPSLLKIPSFLVEFVTPIVRVTKKSNKKIRKDFFTIPEYIEWFNTTPDVHAWDPKYYKGLGTSTDADGREYFQDMERHLIPFHATQEGDHELIELAFAKKHADARKEWLRQLKPGTFLDHSADEITISDFINKELILFSMADNIRSIPSIADGLKPGQRKVIWACFKRNSNNQVKVAQLVGYISEHSAYHHGEASLVSTIINLAQDYVGSNNINLLEPAGQFGSRAAGGKDHASARYIFTQPLPISRYIFHPADDPILKYQVDDGKKVEPEYYMPIVPQLLVNGSEGIGTGWSTHIPSYNPSDIVANIKRLIKGEEMVPMWPWWRGYKGNLKKTGESKWDVCGIVEKIKDNTIQVTELPIHKWTNTFKAELDEMYGEKGDGPVKDFRENHTMAHVDFTISMTAEGMAKAEQQGLEDYFKLTTKLSTGNMICFDFEGKIRKYDTPEQILEDFYPVRLAFYQKRKDYLSNELEQELDKISNQARFIQMIVNKDLVISNRKKADIVAELRTHKFKPIPKITKTKASAEEDAVLENAEEIEAVKEEEQTTGAPSDFDYLLGMAIWSLTKEKIQKLLEQAAEKEHELKVLLGVSPAEMWIRDLDAFLVQWEKTLDEWTRLKVKGEDGKGIKPKQTTIRTRKSIGKGKGKKQRDESEDDSEDDFRPTKATAKAAPKKPASELKTTTARAAAKDKMDVDPKPPLRAKPAPKKVETDSDIDEIPPPDKGKGKAKASPKRKLSETEDDDDDDMYIKPVKKAKTTVAKASSGTLDTFLEPPRPTAKPTAKVSKVKAMAPKSPPKPKKAPAKKVIDSDDEVEDSMDDTPPARAPAPAKRSPRRAAKAPAKYIDISSEDDKDENDDSFVLE
ncbi:type II DNA topoisomerase [Sistotremastrum suecicum HHB10207 ss-3]|uniref:DNA topoisomerase 2 n=1 Tax=Sistotremastrum suecicum HHB10207 ss-3 TaxID=1314776 RepID=A0A166HLS3_9AGAM|nr:type II DNA topoisomerase [Sistotremastrum suecicum HHB10207 ss-3]